MWTTVKRCWAATKGWISRNSGYAIALSLLGAVAFSVLIGYVGAPAHREFDWPLAAVAATAFGTLALAGYTAWLAISG